MSAQWIFEEFRITICANSGSGHYQLPPFLKASGSPWGKFRRGIWVPFLVFNSMGICVGIKSKENSQPPAPPMASGWWAVCTGPSFRHFPELAS